MLRTAGVATLALLLVATGTAMSQDVPPVDPEPRPLGEHQDAPRLTHLVAGVVPPDGLLTVGLRGSRGSTLLRGGDELGDFNAQEVRLWLGYGLLPWLHLQAETGARSVEATAFNELPGGWGLADSRVAAVLGVPTGWESLRLSLFGGATLPTGDADLRYTEDVTSHHAGAAATLRVWIRSQLPEMRLHVNLGRRWNGNEDAGYGVGEESGYRPWFPRYPDAATAGGPGGNDYTLLGGALEFRKKTTALWIEYFEYRLDRDDEVAVREYPRFVTAGLRWGKSEGWALHAAYEVSLSRDDASTPFWPAYPDLTYHLGLSYQIPVGGRDRDGDGVPDRKDACPEHPEDPDGFRDEDGCPDLDNDGDGVPDVRDGAPLAPEDVDGWEDEDGVPDPDNDGDGIPDADDFCPDEPEDFDGRDDTDGCPEEVADSDGDGVADPEDDCPQTPEDRDGFEDDDGCPERDNDLDGIEDARDACPDLPEDYDGDSDGDGCPDPMPVAPEQPAAKPDTTGTTGTGEPPESPAG